MARPVRRRGEGVRRHRAPDGKALAERAGLGWQGKHTNLVSREFGSWLFLGSVLTDAGPAAPTRRARPLRLVQRVPGHLPRPTPSPRRYRLDARRCISYLTIELSGPIPMRVPPGPGQPHLRLRRLPGRLPVEQVRQPVGRDGCHARETLKAAVAGRAGRPGRPRRSGPCSQEPGQAHRPRPVRAQRALRDRQQRGDAALMAVVGPRCCPTRPPSCAARRCGRRLG